MAIIFITHDLGVIAQMADDVVVMYLGRVMEHGPVDDIFHAPKHPYTQALLRSIPSVHSTPRVQLPDHQPARSRTRSTGRPAAPSIRAAPGFMAGRCDQRRSCRAGGRDGARSLCRLLPVQPGRGIRCQGGNLVPEPLLEVRNLKKYFPIQKGFLRRVVGHVRAVDDVSFTIHEGETLGLVGESGCGKTTTVALHPARPDAHGRPDPLPHRGRRDRRPGHPLPRRAAAAAPADADDLPGPLRLAEPAHDPLRHRRRAAAGERHDRPAKAHRRGWPSCCSWWACGPSSCSASPTPSAAASASASASPARWPCTRAWWWPTSRCRRSTSRCRRRCSTCCWSCSRDCT